MPVFIAFNGRDIMGTSLNSRMPTRHCISQSSLSLQNLLQLLFTHKGDTRATPSPGWGRNWNVHGQTPPFPRLRCAGWLLALPGFFLQATTSMLWPSHVFCLHRHLQIWTDNALTNFAPSAAALVFPLCSE